MGLKSYAMGEAPNVRLRGATAPDGQGIDCKHNPYPVPAKAATIRSHGISSLPYLIFVSYSDKF